MIIFYIYLILPLVFSIAYFIGKKEGPTLFKIYQLLSLVLFFFVNPENFFLKTNNAFIFSLLLEILSFGLLFFLYKKSQAFYQLLLILKFFSIGLFFSNHLLIFYMFWESTVIPLYFLIFFFGQEERQEGAQKFLKYMILSSIPMIFSLIYIGITAQTMFINKIILSSNNVFVFIGLIIPIIVKMPLVPFHRWLTKAHVEAPTVGSMLLAGIFLKLSLFLFFTFIQPMFSDLWLRYQSIFLYWGLFSYLYASFCAVNEKNFKRIIAYASVGHMSYIFMGLAVYTKISLKMSLFQMFSHGIISYSLFYLVGSIIEKTHYKYIDDSNFIGLKTILPKISLFLTLFIFASLGLPGFSNFIPEFFLFKEFIHYIPHGIFLIMLGIFITTFYHLYPLKKILYGKNHHSFQDISNIEVIGLLFCLSISIIMGIVPGVFLRLCSIVF